MGVNRMTGTPWHTELFTKKEGEAKRHRGRCANYNHTNKHCKYYFGPCKGSAHCTHYIEEVKQPSSAADNKNNKPKFSKSKSKPKANPYRGRHVYEPGDRVEHKSFGPGTIIYIEGDILKILLDNGEEKELSESCCVKRSLLTRIKSE